MTGSLRRHPLALRDVEDSAVWLARDEVAVALRFLDAVERTLAVLAAHPALGRTRTYDQARLRGVRSFAVRGFSQHLVLYRPTDDGIEVLRVLHGARDFPDGPGDAFDA